MPTVTFNKKEVLSILGEIDDTVLKDRISMIGTDLEYVDDKEICVEIFPNRPDMLSLEGFAFAIKNFIGRGKGFEDIKVEKSEYKVIVDDVMKDIRPYTVAAVVKGIKFDEASLESLIQLQEKLDMTFCRKRKKAAIGVYPYNKISWPIKFTARNPKEIIFTPLEGEKMSADKILEFHPTGKKYAHLLEGFTLFPLFEDSKGSILSIPPIINSEETGRVTVNDTDLFIEVSGYDLWTLEKVLNIILFTLQSNNGKVYEVKIEYKDEIKITPNNEPQRIDVNINYVNKFLGIKIDDKEYDKLLGRMGLKQSDSQVIVPSYRTDIMHPIDIVEDIAIAYGYENFASKIPKISTIAREDPKEIFKKKIISHCIGFGFQETLSYHLIPSHIEKLYDTKYIEIMNPMNEEYDSLRSTILLSLLDILSNNKHSEMPRTLFEIGRVFKQNNSKDTGILEYDELGIVIEDTKADYTMIRQIFDSIMRLYYNDYAVSEPNEENNLFFEGRHAIVKVKEVVLAEFGEINPEVLHGLKIENPVCGLKLNVDLLYDIIMS